MNNMSSTVEQQGLLSDSKPNDEEATYGSVQGSVLRNDDTSRASYSEYHKVCDMRTVIDTSIVGSVGIFLTFMLVFTSWCAWHESVEWVGTTFKFEGQTLVSFAAAVNACTAILLVVLIVGMRFIIGPILSLTWRAVFATLIVMTAITVWEALEATIDMLVGSDVGNRATFFLIACAVSCVVMFVFEKVFRYDVIGNHLLVPP